MKVTTIRVAFGRTMNLGDYESARFDADIQATLEPGDKVEQCYEDLWKTAKQQVRVRIKQQQKSLLAAES